MKKCKKKTKDGKPCPARPMGNGLCQMHQPGAAKELSAKAVEVRRCEREKARQDASELLSVPKDGAAIQDTIRECIGEVRAGKLDPEVSRAVAQLAGVFFRGVEIVELEQRIAAIEERQRAQSQGKN
jgi:hypothetical protein